MMNKTILMLSASCMSIIAGADLCYADFNHFDTSPSFIPAGVKSHVSTHTSHLTAGHLSSLEDFAELTLPENSGNYLFYPLPKDLGRGRGGFHNIPLTQLAAACFVTDTTNCSGNEFANADSDDNDGGVPPGGDDYDLDNEERCRQEGYNQTSCPEGQEPSNTCPYDSNYFEKCVSSCPSNYVTCEPPYYGVGEACDGKYASCEKDTERACQELNPGYVDECGTGQQLSDDRCSYDSSYGTCCNICEGYDNTTIPEGYVQDGQSCLGCDGQEHYKIKPNPCDGYMDCGSMGGEAGAKTCLSGSTTMYDNCKACPNLGSLTYCPTPFTCTYEECSGLWYKTGCQPGYDWNESTKTCTAQCAYECTLTSCPSPFTCTYEDCSGKYCKTGCGGQNYIWNETAQTCTCSPEFKYTCSGSGYHKLQQTFEKCDGKFQRCLCDDVHFWDDTNEICTQNECLKGSELGYFLYSDMTRSKDLDNNKTPIGFVVCSYADGGGQAMALEYLEQTELELMWPTKDIAELQNYSSYLDAVQDTNSCANTKIIENYDSDVIKALKEYHTEGTKAGDWCLPAAGVLMSMKVRYNLGVSENLKDLSNSTSKKIFSSTEYNNLEMWTGEFYLQAMNIEHLNKDNNFYTLPVIPFCQEGYSYDYDTNTCKKAERAEWGKCNGYAKNCNIGDIVYSDGTCSAPSLSSGKKPIAVVVYKSSDGNCAQAMDLMGIGSNYWSTEYTDIPGLTNYASAAEASSDFASCSNTAKIIAAGDKSKYPAAWAAHEYKTEGTEAGDWCLPAAGIITSIYNNEWDILPGFSLAGGMKITTSLFWSSSEINSKTVWYSTFTSDLGLYANGSDKNKYYEIFPVLEF